MSQSSMFTGMLITLASCASEEQIIEMLEKGLSECKQAMLLNPSEDDKKKILQGALSMPCMMILIKTCGDDPMKLIRDMSDLDRVRNLITPNKS